MKSILIVEDNIEIHNLIKEILEKENYKILNAYSGTETLMLIEKENIDLILLDLMLPGLNGEEIVKQILTQETFYRAVKKINTFKGDCKMSVWLCQIAKNLWYDERKTKITLF